MLLPSTKRAKLESNEMCNAVRPNEIKNSPPAFKNILRCCANIMATGANFKGELSQLKLLGERAGNCSAKFESHREIVRWKYMSPTSHIAPSRL